MKNEENKLTYLQKIYDEAESLWRPGNTPQDYEEIIELYTEIIEIDQDFNDTLERRARTYQHAGQYALAIKDLEHIYSLYPGSHRYLRLIAEVQIDQQDYPAALETLSQVLERDENDIYARESRMKVNLVMGRIKEAQLDGAIVKEWYEKEEAKWDDPDHYYHYK